MYCKLCSVIHSCLPFNIGTTAYLLTLVLLLTLYNWYYCCLLKLVLLFRLVLPPMAPFALPFLHTFPYPFPHAYCHSNFHGSYCSRRCPYSCLRLSFLFPLSSLFQPCCLSHPHSHFCPYVQPFTYSDSRPDLCPNPYFQSQSLM